jgi:hypothetical protein
LVLHVFIKDGRDFTVPCTQCRIKSIPFGKYRHYSITGKVSSVKEFSFYFKFVYFYRRLACFTRPCHFVWFNAALHLYFVTAILHVITFFSTKIVVLVAILNNASFKWMAHIPFFRYNYSNTCRNFYIFNPCSLFIILSIMV